MEEPQFAARATPLGVGVRLDGSVGFHTNRNHLTSEAVRIAIAAVTTGGASDIPAVDEVRVRAASSVSNTSHQREQQTYCYLLHLNLLVVENTCYRTFSPHYLTDSLPASHSATNVLRNASSHASRRSSPVIFDPWSIAK